MANEENPGIWLLMVVFLTVATCTAAAERIIYVDDDGSARSQIQPYTIVVLGYIKGVSMKILDKLSVHTIS